MKSSSAVMSQPIRSGAASRDQSVIWVYCSSGVRPVGCSFGPHPTIPTTSMSGSFQWPGPENSAHFVCEKPMPVTLRQLSRMSPVVRQAFVSRAQSAAPENGALLERLRAMSRPLSSSAVFISSTCGVSIGFQSYFR